MSTPAVDDQQPSVPRLTEVQGSRTATALLEVGLDTCVLCADENLLEKLNKLNVVMIKEELTQDDADVEDIWVMAACTDSGTDTVLDDKFVTTGGHVL